MDPQATPGLQLRNQYTRETPSRPNNDFNEYIAKLKGMGIQVHPALSPAYFALKNGLQYPGIVTSQLIDKQGTILVQVPQKMVLSSMKALQEPALSEIYEQPFYNDESTWQDRILLTYILFLVSTKAESNIFYDMAQHMSKEIDVALCWPEEQLQMFKDKTVKCAAEQDKKSFEEEWQLFQEVQKKYKLLQNQWFNKENYRWIFIHLASRAFGKAMDYTSFVPFCQFFNHHSSSVRYQINLPTKKQDFKKQPTSQQQQQLESISSDGSYDSKDYLEQGEFAYDELDIVYLKWGEKECLDLEKKEKKEVQEKVAKLLERVELEVDWRDFSVLFVGQFVMRVKMVQNQYVEGRKGYQQTCKTLHSLTQILQKYIALVKAFYQLKKGKSHKYLITNRQNLEPSPVPSFTRPSPKTYKPQYTEFYLKTGHRDRFLSDNQVYFCYGPNSNRVLLLNYGFAIEGNKYEHVWLSYPLDEVLRDMPDLMQRVQVLGLSIRRKFKVNYTRLNLDLIVFFRLNSWNLYSVASLDDIFYVTNIANQLLILQQIRSSLQFTLQIYHQQSPESLTDKSLNYHQYFIRVYNLQKKRILERQIEIFDKLMGVLTRLQNGETLGQAQAHLTPAERYIVRKYLRTVVL